MLFKEDISREGHQAEAGTRGLATVEDGTALRLRIHERLLDLLNLSLLDKTPREALRVEIRGVVGQLLLQEKRLLTISQIDQLVDRSEERRVGKECRSRWSP